MPHHTQHLTEVKKALEGVRFPADKYTLVDYAKQHNAPSEVIDMLQQLLTSEFGSPNATASTEYKSLDDLMHELERVEQ